ncbi:MAG: hypothetical protein ACPGUU_06640 [Flavobacteriaceae bacterium]
MKKLTYLLVIIFISSCSKHLEHSLEDSLILENVKINQNVTLKNGILSADSKEAFLNLYEDVKSKGAESFFYEKIRPLQKFGFKPLRPFFKDSEEEEFKSFLKLKKEKLNNKNNQNKNKSFYKVNGCLPNNQELKTTDSVEQIIELDDYVIIDNNFAVLLNEEREIIVEGKLYKYQGDGIFIVEEERIPEFKLYVEGDVELNSLYTDNDFGKVEMKYDDTETDCTYGGGGSTGGTSTTVEPDFYEAKLNFGTSEFSKNPSIWGSVFGYARKQYVYLPDKKRIKLKFWNRNYVLFKSFGTEIRFQKKVSFLFISGWQKSYPSKIALGINHLKYNFERGAGNYLNNSFFHQKLFSYKGYHYFSDGTTSYTPPPTVAFPLAETLGLHEGLKLTKTSPFTNFNFSVSITQHEYASLVNKAGSALLNLGIKEFPGLFNISTENPSLFTTEFFKNAISVEIFNKNWKAVNDNNITKYLDFSVPSISLTAKIGATGESFFSNPNTSFPNLDFETYKTSSIDFYGAVLYKNVWYGVRMISDDFKR